MTSNDGSSSRLDEDLLRQVRAEIDRSAEDLHRLTERVNDQNLTMERLEMLVTELLDLLPAPAVVVDADGLIAAVSQGTGEHDPELWKTKVGRPATSGLPARLGNDIIAVGRAREQPPEAVTTTRAGKADVATHWVDVDGARALALPGGWVLAVLSV